MNKIIIILVTLTALSGCNSDEFLDLQPLDKISSEGFVPDLALTGVYDGMQSFDISMGNIYHESITPMTQMRVEYEGFKAISLGAHDAFSAPSSRLWTDGYRGIFLANDFIEKLEGVEIDANLKTQYTAEARFIRAFMHHLLANVFGDIVYLDHVPGIEEARTLTQIPHAEAVSKIIADLDYAIDNLPAVHEQVGRITKGAALGLKARVHLYQNDFTNVKAATDALMALNTYELEDNYSQVWDFENENNPEVVFDIQFIGPGIGEGSFLEHLMGTKDRSRNGWFHNAPTKFMVDLYETVDGSPVDPDNPYANRDPRFYESIFYPGSTIYGSPFTGSDTYSKLKTKFAVRKFIIEDDGSETNAVIFDGPNNIIIVRYADVLLMAAEAENELNGPAGAYAYINPIRSRAGITPLLDGLDKSAMREAIHKERMIELAFEGLHYADMKRWMAPDEVKAYIENNPPQNDAGDVIETRVFDVSKQMLWPVPQTELDNVPTLKQNPNWGGQG